MTYPGIGNYGTASASSTSPVTSATTGSLAVVTGDSVYVFIGYADQYASLSVGVSSVTDSAGSRYRKAGGIANTVTAIYPAIEVWYADNIEGSASPITVTVNFSNPTMCTISAVEITGADAAGSLDAVSAGKTGASLPNTAPSSQDPITTVNSNDLVVACVCFGRGVGAVSSGGGFTFTSAINVLGGGGVGNTGIEGFYDDATTPGTYDARVHGTNLGYPYAIFSVAIRLASGVSQWSGLAGKPFMTVSPRGIGNGLASILNNGADFGPDTPGTTTSGIQEALNFLSEGGTVYCQNGTFNVSSPLINTGSDQQVIFAAGSVIEFDPSTTPWTTSTGRAVLIMVGTNNGSNPGVGNYANYSHCKWLGYGTSINANLAGSGASQGGAAVFGVVQAGLQQGSGIAVGEDIEIDGFTLQNVPATAVVVCVENYEDITALTNPTQDYQVSDVKISRIFATWPNSGTGSVFGIQVIGSARAVAIEDCIIDASGVAQGVGPMHSNLFFSASAGEEEQVRVSRCTFVNNGYGQVFEIQANTSSLNTGQQRSIHEIAFEDCIFDSGQTSTAGYLGSGGGVIDDQGTTSNPGTGFVFNIEFRRTQFVNVGLTTSGAQNALGGTKTKFGYLRFTDDSRPAGFQSTSYGRLLGRGPADVGIDLTSSYPGAGLTNGVDWTNTFGFPIRVFISGGSSVTLSVNGQPTSLTSGTFIIRESDKLNVTWSTPPAILIWAQSL